MIDLAISLNKMHGLVINKVILTEADIVISFSRLSL